MPVYAAVNKNKADKRSSRSSGDGQCYANLPDQKQSPPAITQQVSIHPLCPEGVRQNPLYKVKFRMAFNSSEIDSDGYF